MKNLSLLAGSALALDNQAGANPIRRVVTLLQDMQKELEAEGKKEDDLYRKFNCYCTGNTENLSSAGKCLHLLHFFIFKSLLNQQSTNNAMQVKLLCLITFYYLSIHLRYASGEEAAAQIEELEAKIKEEKAEKKTLVEELKGESVYNLWVTGDGTYNVNGYGTHSIIFDGGFMRNAYDQRVITYKDVLN